MKKVPMWNCQVEDHTKDYAKKNPLSGLLSKSWKKASSKAPPPWTPKEWASNKAPKMAS